MESPAHFPGGSGAASCPKRPRARTSQRRGRQLRIPLRVAALLASLSALLVLGSALAGGALAASGCAAVQTTSADGKAVYGSPCADKIVVTSPDVKQIYAGAGDDVIYANSDVEEIHGGEGDDVIYGELQESSAGSGVTYESPSYQPALRSTVLLAATTNTVQCEANPCYGGDGSQEMFGGRGRDEMFGERGNDTLHGEGGNDMLYGGIGDDTAFGDDGYDLLSGGLGTDLLDGKEGNDTVRGEGTVDVLRDSGSKADTDTLSFATAVTPGFHGVVSAQGFPADADNEERGVEVRLDGALAGCGVQACNNDARYGGGGDEISVAGFENVIGSPFADHIVGSATANRIDGGGGADVIEGGEGNDRLFGGTDGDYISGGGGEDRTYFGESAGNNCAADVEIRYGCTGSNEEVHQRDRSKIEVGYMSPAVGGTESSSLFLLGSEGTDIVHTKIVFGGLGGYVDFKAAEGSAVFDESPSAVTANCNYKPSEVRCFLGKIDALTLAGMAGDDTFTVATENLNWQAGVTPVLLGGEGNDNLSGSGETEDLLVDGNGPGNDVLSGLGRDDGLLNNEGFDQLNGGNGSDLLLSVTTCEGDILQGADSKDGDGEGVNSASWAQLPAAGGGVAADLRAGQAGSGYASGPTCGTGSVDSLRNIDDLEGSSQADVLYGDSASNNLLGRKGEDGLYGRLGDDSIEAEDRERDKVSGGGGSDICTYDKGVDIVNLCGDQPGMAIGEGERAPGEKPSKPAPAEEHAKQPPAKEHAK